MTQSTLSDIINWLLAIVNSIVAVVFAPISLLIHNLLPGIEGLFTNISAWLLYATTYVGWVIDAFGIPSIVLSVVASYYVYKVGSSFAVYGLKLAVKWYEALKP